MAWITAETRAQLRAIGFLRWRLFINSLRTIRGKLTFVSRAIAGILVLGAGIGGGLGLGIASWQLTLRGKPEWLTFPLWGIFVFWQMFPLMATAFNQNTDASALMRFPMSYPAYFLVRMIYSSLDIATALGLSWCFGILAGVSAADLRLAPWTALAILLFALFNILVGRLIFFSIERWLSRRRSREIMGLLFFLVVIGFQVAGPLIGRYGDRAAPAWFRLPAKLAFLQQVFPPGLAGGSLAYASHKYYLAAVLSLAAISAYGVTALWFLHRRLRDQYRGESLSEGERRQTAQTAAVVHRGWSLLGIKGPLAAVYEKEMRYFSRSGPLLFTLIMPLVVVLVLWGGRRGFLTHQAGFALPVGAAYCLLLLTNIVYNSFGGDSGGIQFFLSSPVSFRKIAGAKNLAQLTIFVFDIFILWLGVRVVYEPPKFRVVALTIAWCLFAIPLNFAIGNLLSLYSPKRIDYATFGRQRAAESTIIISLVVQMSAIGVGAVCILVARLYSNLWAATFALLVLSVPAIIAYFVVLARLDSIVMGRREVLASELCRA